MKNDEDIIQSLDNAWIALCKEYDKCREEHIRLSINLLGKIIDKVKGKPKNTYEQITIEQWLEWMKQEV